MATLPKIPDCCDWCKEVCDCTPDPYTGEWPACCTRITSDQTFYDGQRWRDYNDNVIARAHG
jgi:hypothetical protein